jgi:two-component system CheB/CheR fusion protein
MSPERPVSNPSSGEDAEPEDAMEEEGAEPDEEEQVKSEGAYPIIGIGASAGGLEALKGFFRAVPKDAGMAFVVVTHQHPGHASLLPELLARETEMPVEEAADGVRLQTNHVYVAPSSGHLGLLHGKLRQMDDPPGRGVRMQIDSFFRSLADDQGERAVCIIFSGTGTDGTLGMKAIKGAAGMAMVQKPQTADYAGMPSSAIATGLADYILAPELMPEQLVGYVRGGGLLAGGKRSELPELPAEPLQKIFLLLRGRTGHDFSAYKPNTIRRRIERRMNVHQIRNPDVYVRFLQENPHEIDMLFKELLISVTNFFRDPEAWESLAVHLADLVRERAEDQALRAWVPGCATGEEAFSLAIALNEVSEKQNRHHEIQIFGTDLDPVAIETARAGEYPEGIGVDVSVERLEHHFVGSEGLYRIRKGIREMLIFAQQNVIKDPPFTKLDIICCRNLMIYLGAGLQRKLLPLFHYALKPGGLLFLGPSETIGAANELFEVLDKRWKIYRRKDPISGRASIPVMPSQRSREEEDLVVAHVSAPAGERERHVTLTIKRMLLDRFAPACVVASPHGEIVFIHGKTGAYLEPSQGEPRNNVIEMAREGLAIELAAAIRECLRTHRAVSRQGVGLRWENGFQKANFKVEEIREPEAIRGLVLITFLTAPPEIAVEPDAKASHPEAKDGQRVDGLERELRFIKESHQMTLEELETSNEELKSANEELQSTNEELQSTNEELETSKEEMQSLNEELTTVNAELQSKLDELSQANDDMQNLLNSTDIATVFLDNDLNIKRFTEQAKSLVMLRANDVGRPFSELVSNLEIENLADDCREVLRTLVFREATVKTRDGSSYLMRIMPYRTAENVIDGVVLTFVNIGRLGLAIGGVLKI